MTNYIGDCYRENNAWEIEWDVANSNFEIISNYFWKWEREKEREKIVHYFISNNISKLNLFFFSLIFLLAFFSATIWFLFIPLCRSLTISFRSFVKCQTIFVGWRAIGQLDVSFLVISTKQSESLDACSKAAKISL